jgi:hypothetical protein
VKSFVTTKLVKAMRVEELLQQLVCLKMQKKKKKKFGLQQGA